MISSAVADPPDVKLSPPGAAGNTVDQNRLKPCRQRLFGLQGDLKSERQNGNSSSIDRFRQSMRSGRTTSFRRVIHLNYLHPIIPVDSLRRERISWAAEF